MSCASRQARFACTRLPASLACACLALGAIATAQQAGSEAAEIEQLAEEAFIYGFPMVMNIANIHGYSVDKTSPQYKGPFNQVVSEAHVFTARDTKAAMTNCDTPYSYLVMDLRAEPLVLSVPVVEERRYHSVQLVDLYTCNFGYIGARETGNSGGVYLIAGPNWHGDVPSGISKTFRCETELALAIIRTQLFDPSDLDNVKRIQAGYKAQPLSQFMNTTAPPPAPTINWSRFEWRQAGANAFGTLNFALQFCPAVGAAEVEAPLRERLSGVGIEPGRAIDITILVPSQKEPVMAGIRKAVETMKEARLRFADNANGWLVGSAYGDRAYYNGDWTLRAAAVMAGIYGNDAAEALVLLLAVDAEGTAPDCSANRYTLTFAKDQLPPVNAFWSLTMYDGRTQLLVDNPINRYVINSRMLDGMQTNADGSLTIHVQKESPGQDRESNWLPAPNGPMLMMLRLYWPRDEAIKGTWKPPVLFPVRP